MMSEETPPTASEIHLKVRELLGRATLLRTKGQRQDALQLAQQAVGLDDKSWEAHELVGDLLLDLGRGDFALDSYRRARELHPSRTALEDKIARAALAKAARLQATMMSEAILSGRVKPPRSARKPGLAAVMSVVPGLGQLYNGQVLKGFGLVALFVFCFALMVISAGGRLAISPVSSRGLLYGPEVSVGGIISVLFSGVTLVWTISLLIVWVYSMVDAGIGASRARDSYSSGMV